jgi:hypothetical protein
MGGSNSREDSPGGVLQLCCSKHDDKPDRNAWTMQNDVVQLHRATVEGDETCVSDPVFQRACAR